MLRQSWGLVKDSCISRVRHINDTSLVHTSFFPSLFPFVVSITDLELFITLVVGTA